MRELAFLIILLGFLAVIASSVKKDNKLSPKNQTTTITVKNSYSDTVEVWLTIGAPDKNWISSVNGIFGITTKGLKGMFVLAPNQSLTYKPKKGIQGNICFLTDSYQCLNDSTAGTTIVEFCLNNYNPKIPMAQETVEISCVSGISYIASIDMTGGKGIWTANHPDYDTITHIENSTFGKNSGIAGVYPYGCDNCTYQSNIAPSCTIGKNEAPQTYPICNVQRNASQRGGNVTITFKKPIAY